MEERVLISLLLDFYGPLLTDKQRMSLQLHHEDDMSLGEIAEELGVSRQAVHDNLQRARHILNDYESKLHLVAQYEQREGLLSQLKATLPKEVLPKPRCNKYWRKWRDIMAFDSLSEKLQEAFQSLKGRAKLQKMMSILRCVRYVQLY